MSDFFSPLEEDVVRRTRQDEDEERLAEEALDAVGDRARVFALWNEETRDAIERGALKPTTLLVATTPWACGLVFDTVEAGAARLRPMGTITVAGVSARGIAASGTIGREDPVGTLFQTETIETSARGDDDQNLCVLTVNHDVPADRAREYAKTLLDLSPPSTSSCSPRWTKTSSKSLPRRRGPKPVPVLRGARANGATMTSPTTSPTSGAIRRRLPRTCLRASCLTGSPRRSPPGARWRANARLCSPCRRRAGGEAPRGSRGGGLGRGRGVRRRGGRARRRQRGATRRRRRRD